MPHVCPVCGFPDLELPPRGVDGGGSVEICPSCGYQFGVDDDDRRILPEAWRRRWTADGMNWWSRGQRPPPDWDPIAQLKGIQAAPTAPRRRIPRGARSPRSSRRNPDGDSGRPPAA